MKKTYNGLIIFGEMGSGKDALADELKKIDERVNKYNIGNIIRTIRSVIEVNPEWKDKERTLYQIYADKLREIYPTIMCDYTLSLFYTKWQKKLGFNNTGLKGEEFEKQLLQQLAAIKEYEIPVIVGGRTLVDYDYWRKKNFFIVGISINHNIRCERLSERDGMEVAKNSNSNHNTESEVPYIVNNLCEFLVDNNGTLENLNEQARKILDLI